MSRWNRSNSGAVSGKDPKPTGTQSGSGTAVLPTPGPLGHNDAADPAEQERRALERLLKQYRDLIADARSRGRNVAADNLQHWLDGSGEDKMIPAGWLRGFSSVEDAEAVNLSRFEETIGKRSLSLKDGERRVVQDYWDRKLTASVFDELYYASGTSTLTSRGVFTLKRDGDWVTITGEVEHHWWDPYDWHENLAAFIPGHGTIRDADALRLEAAGHGNAFGMYSFWHQDFEGKYGIDTGLAWRDQKNYTWKPVQAGRASGETAGAWPATHDAMTDSNGKPLPGLSK